MTIDELYFVLRNLMSARKYEAAAIVRAELTAREIARDAILDYAEEQAG
jgi:hypothetical protein